MQTLPVSLNSVFVVQLDSRSLHELCTSHGRLDCYGVIQYLCVLGTVFPSLLSFGVENFSVARRLLENLRTPVLLSAKKGKKGKVHPCTGTEALYRLYGPKGE